MKHWQRFTAVLSNQANLHRLWKTTPIVLTIAGAGTDRWFPRQTASR